MSNLNVITLGEKYDFITNKSFGVVPLKKVITENDFVINKWAEHFFNELEQKEKNADLLFVSAHSFGFDGDNVNYAKIAGRLKAVEKELGLEFTTGSGGAPQILAFKTDNVSWEHETYGDYPFFPWSNNTIFIFCCVSK